MSTTTTEILFNSPALHSLKRDQLVKLCKIHAIKANGKNSEMVERLKECAKGLPRGSALSVAARSEEDQRKADTKTGEEAEWRPRPSEQWEVMESIIEENESQGTSGQSEFGTASSKCACLFFFFFVFSHIGQSQQAP